MNNRVNSNKSGKPYLSLISKKCHHFFRKFTIKNGSTKLRKTINNGIIVYRKNLILSSRQNSKSRTKKKRNMKRKLNPIQSTRLV